MKKKIKTLSMLIVFTIALAITSKAQLSKFIGTYSGRITQSNGTSMWVRFRITDNGVTQYFFNSETRNWYSTTSNISRYACYENNLIFYWINTGGVWTETQSFSLSYINDSKLYVVWSRQVNNSKEDTDNSAWSLNGSGYITED